MFLAETSAYGTEPRFAAKGVKADLDGDGKVEFGEAMPDADFYVAAMRDFERNAKELDAAARAYKPTEADALTALVVMTPTMSEYFEAWKNSRFVSGEGHREGVRGRVAPPGHRGHPRRARADLREHAAPHRRGGPRSRRARPGRACASCARSQPGCESVRPPARSSPPSRPTPSGPRRRVARRTSPARSPRWPPSSTSRSRRASRVARARARGSGSRRWPPRPSPCAAPAQPRPPQHRRGGRPSRCASACSRPRRTCCSRTAAGRGQDVAAARAALRGPAGRRAGAGRARRARPRARQGLAAAERGRPAARPHGAGRGARAACRRRCTRAATASRWRQSRRGTPQRAREWLLLRGFRTATRFTRPSADATLAVRAWPRGRLSVGAARCR